jgi:hypothetical protein
MRKRLLASLSLVVLTAPDAWAQSGVRTVELGRRLNTGPQVGDTSGPDIAREGDCRDFSAGR